MQPRIEATVFGYITVGVDLLGRMGFSYGAAKYFNKYVWDQL